MTRLSIVLLWFACFTPAQTPRCVEVEGDRILARDFAVSLPGFGGLSPETAIAPAPQPGVHRFFRPFELACPGASLFHRNRPGRRRVLRTASGDARPEPGSGSHAAGASAPRSANRNRGDQSVSRSARPAGVSPREPRNSGIALGARPGRVARQRHLRRQPAFWGLGAGSDIGPRAPSRGGRSAQEGRGDRRQSGASGNCRPFSDFGRCGPDGGPGCRDERPCGAVVPGEEIHLAQLMLPPDVNRGEMVEVEVAQRRGPSRFYGEGGIRGPQRRHHRHSQPLQQ